MLTSNSRKMVWAFQAVIVLSILYEIVTREDLSVGIKAVCTAGILLMQVNDFFRKKYRLSEGRQVLFTISMVVNIAAIAVFMVLIGGTATGVYYIFPLVELFLSGRSFPKRMVILHVLVFLAGVYVSRSDIQTSLISYFALLLLVFLFRGLNIEKEKGQLLNAELVEAHAKLKEITIVKERTRIAQEMHDSIGHSLIALRMHLEFAENMIEANPKQAREVLAKAHSFSQQSIKELRKAVAVLKDQSATSQIALEELLIDMIESLQTSGKLKFTLNFDKEVESSNQDMKNCIYNSVREAVTNGLKHGKAQQFLIDISKSGNKICVIVEDNGEGCGNIKKSNGLQGIEERITLLNGEVNFSSEKGRGFKVLAEIPA